MPEKTVTTICQIRKYEHDGAHRISIYKPVMDQLDIKKGDFVEITIKKIQMAGNNNNNGD